MIELVCSRGTGLLFLPSPSLFTFLISVLQTTSFARTLYALGLGTQQPGKSRIYLLLLLLLNIPSSAWRHWGCVTPEELKLMKLQIESGTNPDGFDSLKKEDQARICKAIEVGEIAEEDKEKPDAEVSFIDNNHPSSGGGGIESLIGRNKRSQGSEETSLSAKRRRVTRWHREESVSSEKVR